MFQSRSRIIASAAGLLLLLCTRIEAGEPVQIRGSTEVELPKPNRVLIDRSNINKSAPEDERSGLQGYVRPAPIEGMLLNKKAKHELDKKKNWILVNPYEAHYDSKTEEFLKGEKGTGLYSNRLMSDPEEKTVLEKFISEKSARTREGMSNSRDPDDSEMSQRGDRPDSLSGRDSNRDGDNTGVRADDRPSLFKKDASPAATDLNSKSPIGERVIFADRPESLDLTDGLFSSRGKEDSSPIDQDKLRQQQQAHDQEFTRFLQQPRGGGTSLSLSTGVRLDPLNPAADATRMEANPISAGRSDQFLNMGRSSASSSSFETPGGGSPISASMQDRSSVDDFSSRIAGPRAPSFASPVNSFGSSAAPSFSPSPFQLPFPKRKF